MNLEELKTKYLELISSLEITDDVKQDVWTVLMELELHRLSEEVIELEKEFIRKKEQLRMLEKYYELPVN